MQRIYTGNIRAGEHDLQVFVIGKSAEGVDFREKAHFKVDKDVGPEIVEIALAAQNIVFKDK